MCSCKGKTSLQFSLKEDLLVVMECVTSRKVTVYKAVNIYDIPKPKLFKGIKGLRGTKSSTVGRPPSLLFEEQKYCRQS